MGWPQRLAELLDESLTPGSWTRRVATVSNPFGDGHAARRIVSAIAGQFGIHARPREPVLS